jgi:hypothetical protein
MNDFIEQRIIEAVRKLLSGRVNEILSKWEFLIPVVEFSNFANRHAVVPAVSLTSCERTEKERIIRLDAYSLSISFTLPETQETELYCYGYAAAVCKAIGENPTLGGVVDRAVISSKKYSQPKKPGCGEDWEVVIDLRVTVETMSNEKGGMNN